jgi:hypothetical protein
MFTFIASAKPSAAVVEPSPLLSFIAGEFAERIAGRWSAPHAVFLTAPSARRHLVCLALALGDGLVQPDLDQLLHAPLRRAIRLALGRSLAGLARALGRLGETAWPAEDYRRLVDRLADPYAGKILRHAGQVTPERVRALCRLPAPLLKVGLGRLELSPDQAAVIAEACEALANHHADPQLWGSAPLRWSGAATPEALIGMIRGELEPRPAPSPLLASARLVPLTTREAIRDAALRYRNCLRRQIHNAVGGWSAYYEWSGEPGAIVEIYRDPLFGWRFDQARLAGNEAVPEPLRSEIIAELRQMGVYVGRADWELDGALLEATQPGFKLVGADAQVGWKFGDVEPD